MPGIQQRNARFNVRMWHRQSGWIELHRLPSGRSGELLDIDPDHHFFFLTPGFINFSEILIRGTREENRRRFNMLKGIILIDSLNDMERYRDRIENFIDQTGLDVLEHRVVGLSGLKNVIEEAFQRSYQL